MSHVCDFLVVGGGILGTSIAFHLAQRKAGRVLLLEKAFLGAGHSGKSAALIYQCHPHPLTTALARRCLPVYEHFTDLIGGMPVFWRSGMVQLNRRGEEARLDELLHQQHALGVEVRRIAEHELMELDPSARLAEDELAVYERAAGHVEGVQAVASFAEAAQKNGADIRQGVEVRAFLTEKGKIIGVETNEGIYNCSRLILTAGAWASELLKQLRIDLPLSLHHSQVALFRRPVDSGRRGVIFADFVQDLYVRPAQGELLHVGDLSPSKVASSTVTDDSNEVADKDWLPDVRQRLIRRCPVMHRCFGRGGYAFRTARPPDGQPILDQLPEVEGGYCAVGFGSLNFLLAPVVGQVMTAWLVDGSVPDFDLSAYRLARFTPTDEPSVRDTSKQAD